MCFTSLPFYYWYFNSCSFITFNSGWNHVPVFQILCGSVSRIFSAFVYLFCYFFLFCFFVNHGMFIIILKDAQAVRWLEWSADHLFNLCACKKPYLFPVICWKMDASSVLCFYLDHEAFLIWMFLTSHC